VTVLTVVALAVLDMACTQLAVPRGRYAFKGTVQIQCTAVLDAEPPPLSTCSWAFGDMSSEAHFCAGVTYQATHSYVPRPRPYPATFTVYAPGNDGTIVAEREALTQVGPPKERKVERKKTRIETGLTLKLFPRVGLSIPGQAFHVRAELAYLGPDEPEELYCPKVQWRLNGEEQGSVESDCPAYESRTYFPTKWSRDFWLGPGEHRIAVAVIRGDETIRELTATAVVH